MMQQNIRHYGQTQLTLGTVAYWHATSAPMFNKDSRSEINAKGSGEPGGITKI